MELRLDMAAPGSGSEAGCPKKLDLVFAISAWGTMLSFQERLHEAYAGFIAELRTQAPDWDVNVVLASRDPEGMPPHRGAELMACDKEVGRG